MLRECAKILRECAKISREWL
ncbi:MAG: four-helix bundle copper-binding protein [Bacteroidaceae bacterium]|nr:four-helix bundle copper-binding protein [Bacteroidaceae bacterium]